jgi:hypothetical protein
MKVFAITAILLFAMSSSALAVTENGPAPIQITACVVMMAGTADAVGAPGVTLTNGVTTTLVNNSGKVITALTVAGDYHGRHESATANFTFNPGSTVQITRHFTQSAYVDPDAKCHVTHVDFADGTSWSAPNQ